MLLIPLWRYSALPQNGRWTSRFVNLQGANDRGKAFGERMSELLPPHSLVFCRWSQTHTLFYYQYVKGRLRGVELHHLLPRVEYMRQIIEREAPETLYFTFPPEPLGFQVEEVTPVIRGMELYKVSLGDQ
jgi:hypothetical protein